MLKMILAISAATIVAGSAVADEVWTTPIGAVIYERELPNGDAVLSYPGIEAETRGLAYIHGLAQVYEGRGAFSGVWIEPDLADGEGCAVAIADPESGEARNNWGRIDLVFTEPDFPGGWVAIRGECFVQPDAYLIGKPVVAEGVE
ncbi:hypothetical protein [Hyphomonas johnsonii]|jgi:hypothetical protein|uniref:Uncharacterized protein n=1 Tax=Hyphomonas johnsonii MHS-2 TaxID=1280950 RepID=A0A059FM14_9PROT|nr:hypothetical protein [Hyphomonas johnsonii]KCZ91725.1 hypothetical protein HJO_11427 [Hyphomonas johnsonii MHS-2]